MRDLIVRVVARFMIPFIQVYGLYIVLYGHVSPGGGFAGGTVMAASLILYVLAFGVRLEEKRLPEWLARSIESLGAILFVVLGLVGLFNGTTFLANAGAGFPLGTPGRLFSGGAIFILTFAIGMKVFSTMITLFSHLVEEEEVEEEGSSV